MPPPDHEPAIAAKGEIAARVAPGRDIAANSSNPARAILDPDILQSPFGSRAERSNAGAPNGLLGGRNIWFAGPRWTRLHRFTIMRPGGNMPATGKESRFPQLRLDQLDDQQKPLGEQVMKVSSIGIAGPYNPLLRSPVLGQRLLHLFHSLRWETSVPLRLY